MGKCLMKGIICFARVALALTALSIAGACAKSPSSIAPIAVASAEYEPLNCTDARIELSRVEAKLADANRRQNNAQTGDAIGVFLFLIPFSALAGDAESDVAQYKGEKIALERTIERKKCGSSVALTPDSFPTGEARDKYFDDLIKKARDDADKDVSEIVSRCKSANSEECKATIKVVETSREARVAELEARRSGAQITG